MLSKALPTRQSLHSRAPGCRRSTNDFFDVLGSISHVWAPPVVNSDGRSDANRHSASNVGVPARNVFWDVHRNREQGRQLVTYSAGGANTESRQPPTLFAPQLARWPRSDRLLPRASGSLAVEHTRPQDFTIQWQHVTARRKLRGSSSSILISLHNHAQTFRFRFSLPYLGSET
jgi:hypothetical protein